MVLLSNGMTLAIKAILFRIVTYITTTGTHEKYQSITEVVAMPEPSQEGRISFAV
jgi:hypothetical protein